MLNRGQSNSQQLVSDESLSKNAKCSSSRNYRKVSRGSNVDESLFGSIPFIQSRASQRQATGREIALKVSSSLSNNQEGGFDSVMSKNNKRTSEAKNNNQLAQTITRDQLNHMRDMTKIMTSYEQEVLELAAEAQEEAARIKAKERKTHMMSKAHETAKRAPKTEMEQVFERENHTILARARVLKQQSHDSVKLLKTLGARASAFTIRDQQINELSTRGQGDTFYDEKMNLRMELDRLEESKKQEDIEEAKKAKRISDRIVLERQIHDRKVEKDVKAACVAQEGKDSLVRIRKADESAKKLEKEKLVARQKNFEKVMEFNDYAIQMKQLEVKKIQAEDAKIIAYQKKKDSDLRQREEDETQRKVEAEARCSHLRSMQQKLHNNKADLDELRAKRAAEAKERASRKSELETEKLRQHNMLELSTARKQQALHKRRTLESEAQCQKKEYEAMMERVRKDKNRLELELHTREIKNKSHREGLQSQINAKHKQSKDAFETTQHEGRLLREEYDTELKELEAIRTSEVEQLIQKGVNPKYLSEMKSLDISKIRNC